MKTYDVVVISVLLIISWALFLLVSTYSTRPSEELLTDGWYFTGSSVLVGMGVTTHDD